MSVIRIQGFKGTGPRISARLLPIEMAQQADDSRLFRKEIQPYHALRFVQATGNGNNTQSIYRYVNAGLQYFFDWPTPVQVARVPITGDTKNRIFYTGAPDSLGSLVAGYPKKTGNDIGIPLAAPGGPAAFYKMGVINPTAAPGLANGGGGSGATRATSYITTYVTGWGEEGGVSPAAQLSGLSGDSITVTRGADPSLTGYNILSWNIYRFITGAQGPGYWALVNTGGPIAIGTPTFVDSATDAALVLNGSTFPSANQLIFAEPPTDLIGLTQLPDGRMAGFSPSLGQVCLSEPYFPYAWPVAYRRATQFPPVACGASGTTFIVATQSKPAIFVGTSPSATTGSTLDALQSCLAARGLVESPFGVAWPSPDGLYLVDPSGQGSIITRPLFDKQTWQVLQPGGFIAAVYDGRYYAYAPGISRVLVFDPNEPDDACTFLNIQPTALWSDFQADGLYMAIGGSIYQWDSDGTVLRQYDWRSKVFTDPRPNNKAYARILFNFNNPLVSPSHLVGSFTSYTATRNLAINDNLLMQNAAYAGSAFGAHSFGEVPFGADDYIDPIPDIGTGITLNVYGDAVLRSSQVVTTEDPVRLPGGYLAKEWEVEVLGKVNIEEIALANAMSDLQALD